MSARHVGRILLGLLVAAIVSPVAAQEGSVTFEFNFANPGARSLGLGGAFAGLADDATAAFANPAGLSQLIDPEFSTEARYSAYETPFVVGGRASGRPSGRGVDTVSGLRQGVSKDDRRTLSFFSFVLPRKRWSIALYRHRWADFSLDTKVDGLFAVVAGEDQRSENVVSRTDVRIVNTGVSASFTLSPNFRVGIGVVQFDAQLTSLSREYDQPIDSFYGAAAFDPDLLDTTYLHRASNTDLGLNAGFLWRLSPRWSLGGYFREGPRLENHIVETAGPAEEEFPPGAIELDVRNPLHLPDVFGLGTAFRTSDGRWTVSADWSRVRYSSIATDLSRDVFEPDQIRLDDGDEFRVGLEYVMIQANPILALRCGAWLDPAHRVGSGANTDPFERAVFQAGDDELHFTAGLGIVLPKYQIDLGADLSDRADHASVSFVYRF